MEELQLPELHVMQAVEVIGNALARDTGRHPEWVKRRMRDGLRYLADPANDADTELRRAYQDMLQPVFAMAQKTAVLDTDPWVH